MHDGFACADQVPPLVHVVAEDPIILNPCLHRKLHTVLNDDLLVRQLGGSTVKLSAVSFDKGGQLISEMLKMNIIITAFFSTRFNYFYKNQ